MRMDEVIAAVSQSKTLVKKAVSAPDVLNEAYSYEKPSSFARAMRMDFGDVAVLLISGTGSIGTNGETLHSGDFRAQCIKAIDNLKAALAGVGAGLSDVVKITNYLTDMSSHIGIYREVRDQFFSMPRPASTAVGISQLARPGALFEIEAIAVLPAAKSAPAKARGASRSAKAKAKTTAKSAARRKRK